MLFLQIQTGQMIDFGIVNQSTVQWQDIPSESQIDKKDIVALLNLSEQLDVHGSCTFTKNVVTAIQLQYSVLESSIKFHLKIFGKDQVIDCKTEFAITRQLVDVINGRNTYQLPEESKTGGIYDGNDVKFVESAPISGVGFYSYGKKGSDTRHQPYIFSLNYGIIMKNNEEFVNKHVQSIQSQPGFYTKSQNL